MRHTKQNETHEWAQKISWGVLSCNGTLEIFNCFSQNKLCIFNKWQFQSLPKLVIVLSHNLQMKELLFWAGRRKGEENWLFNPVVGLLAGDKGHIFIPVDVYSIINIGLQPMCSRENHWRGSFSLAQRVLISWQLRKQNIFKSFMISQNRENYLSLNSIPCRYESLKKRLVFCLILLLWFVKICLPFLLHLRLMPLYRLVWIPG